MDKVKKIVDSIVDELDGRKGFEFGYIDEDILDEIKDELVKLILPVVSGMFSEEQIEEAYTNGRDYESGFSSKPFNIENYR